MGVDTHLLLISSLGLVFNNSIGFGKERVIFPHPHIFPGVNSGPFLTDQDVSCLDPLPTESFDAQSLS